MTRIIIAIFFLLIGMTLSAQFKLEGKIVAKNGTDPIVGATIQIQQTSLAVISDVEGSFIFDTLEKGEYTLVVKSVGFAGQTINLSLNSDIKLDVRLEEKIFDLPDVVVESITMTGGKSGVSKSLGSAHFIDQKEIQKFSYTDINRTLRNIPGTNIQEEDGYGLRPNIGLRATGSERSSKITVMEDGVLAAPAPYSAPAAYYFPSIGRMEAIEIMKGSSQIKYGPFTTGGAINLISTPIPTDLSGHADLIAGSDDYKMLHANIGNAHNNVAYLFETLQYGAAGFKNLDSGGNTGFNKKDYLAKVRIHTNPDAPIYQSLTFKFGKAKERSDETYLGLTNEDFLQTPLRRYAGSQEDVLNTNHQQMSLSHYASLSSNLDIYTTLYNNEFSRNWYKLDKVGGQSIRNILSNPSAHAEEMNVIKGSSSEDLLLKVKANNRSYVSKGVQTNVILHFNKNDQKHKIDFGLRIHRDEVDRFQWVDDYAMNDGTMNLYSEGVPGTESNRVSTSDALASYFQYKWQFKKLTLTGGLRYEHIRLSRLDYGKEDVDRSGINISERENKVEILIPGFAASYELLGNSSIFGGIHKGFAPPGSKEGTNPEKSWNYELGYRLNQGQWSAQILGYYNDYSNLLGTDLAASGGAGSHDLFNGGEAVARGLETQLTYNINPMSGDLLNIPITVNYTYSRASFSSAFESDFDAWGEVEEGDLLPYVPKHQLSLGLGMEHKKFLFDINARYASQMLVEAGQFNETLSTTDEAFTIDVALNYKLTNQISVFVNLNNLTNNIYIVSHRPAGVRPNQPRMFKVGLKANF